MSKQTELAQVADTITVNSGKIGIGESDPDTSLDVVGGSADSVIDTLTLKNDNIGASAGTGINFVVDGVNDITTAAIYGQRTGAAYHQGSLQFLTRDNSGGGLAERMRIDSAGRVTMPYQPSFIAYYATTTNLSGSSTVIFTHTRINRGSHYSTSSGRFTAPVSGVYQFNYAVRSSTSQAYCRTRLYKNGATYSIMEAGHAFNNSSHYQYSTVMSLAAGDYVNVNVDAGFTINIDAFSQFSGYLVG